MEKRSELTGSAGELESDAFVYTTPKKNLNASITLADWSNSLTIWTPLPAR